ncbi:MAG: F0F1 ATP synthase subunit A [Anaerolineales bacterium]|nr:F0F1 ATP synthase subunit A [Anaerolineales bacterium]
MEISPDAIVLWEAGIFKINATILFTWLIMGILVIGSWLVTRKITSALTMSKGQNMLEVVVGGVMDQIKEVSQQDPRPYLPFIGSLFLFIITSNVLAIVPGFQPPTGSLSTTAALALCVFLAVPIFGVRKQGWRGYLRQYIQPTPIMLPFNIIGELSRTLALAVRLFGNVMSGALIAAILLAIAPLFFPILLQALGLLTGVIQAYIFSILAMVYIASATRAHSGREEDQSKHEAGKGEREA